MFILFTVTESKNLLRQDGEAFNMSNVLLAVENRPGVYCTCEIINI